MFPYFVDNKFNLRLLIVVQRPEVRRLHYEASLIIQSPYKIIKYSNLQMFT